MRAYRAVAGDSGVISYDIGDDSITVRFHEGATYLYSYASAGKRHVEAMKKLARNGRGLSTYISQNVKERYAAKVV